MDKFNDKATSYIGKIANLTVHGMYAKVRYSKENDICLIRVSLGIKKKNPKILQFGFF